MNVWKPTKDELALIMESAKTETQLKRIELQPGNRYHLHDDSVESSMNIYRVAEDMDDTDLADHSDWDEFKAGVPLTDDGRAMVDFYCYSRSGLESNIIVYYENGQITDIVGLRIDVLHTTSKDV